MPTRQECPNCQVILLLPDSGLGRCPRCKTVVRGRPEARSQAPEEETEPLIPEISDEHMDGPLDTRVSPEPVPLPVPLPAPPPLPTPRSRRPDRRRPLPPIDITVPRAPASKTLPLILLGLGFLISVGMIVFSFIYISTRARNFGVAPPAPMMAPRK